MTPLLAVKRTYQPSSQARSYARFPCADVDLWWSSHSESSSCQGPLDVVKTGFAFFFFSRCFCFFEALSLALSPLPLVCISYELWLSHVCFSLTVLFSLSLSLSLSLS